MTPNVGLPIRTQHCRRGGGNRADAFLQARRLPFTVPSGAPYPGIERTFQTFWDAAIENANSRVYAGIHFRTATTDGLRLGEQVGRFVFTHALKPGK